MDTPQQTEALAFPGGHDDKHHDTQAQRQPAAREQLVEVGREQRNINAQETNQDQPHQHFVPAPVFTRHGSRQDGGQHHRPGHRNAVGGRQITGVLKADDHNHHRAVEHPVHKRNVNLPGFHLRGVNNAHGR